MKKIVLIFLVMLSMNIAAVMPTMVPQVRVELNKMGIATVFAQSSSVGILFPSSGQGVYGQWPVISQEDVRIEAYDTEFRDDVTSVTFEYSTDAINWNFIGTDTNPTREPPIIEDTGGTVPGYSGWNVIWNTIGLDEGKYYVRATMSYSSGLASAAIEEVYFTPIPPRPEIVEPTFLEMVDRQFEVNATSVSQSILLMDVNILIGSKPDVEQNGFPGLGKGSDSLWFGASYCGPGAAAQAIWRLAGKNPGLLNAGSNIVDIIRKNKAAYTLPGEKERDESEFIENGKLTFEGLMLVLAVNMGTSKPTSTDRGGSTSTGDITPGMRKFLDLQGLGCANKKDGYWASSTSDPAIKNVFPPTFKLYNDLLRKGESIIVTWGDWKGPGKDKKAGTLDDEFDGPLHTVVGKGTYPDPKNKLNNKASFLESGDSRPTQKMLWKDKDPNAGGFSTVDGKAIYQLDVISPKYGHNIPDDVRGSWVPKGSDHYGGDGWSVVCDSSSIHDGFYLVRATMNDTVGNWGEDFTTVYINNQIPLAPVNLIASLQHDGTIKLSWDLPLEEPGYDIYGYKVYRDAGFGFELITPEPVHQTFYVDSNLLPNTPYKYKVSSLDFSDSESELSCPSNPIAFWIPVGGFAVPIDKPMEKPDLLAPYIALASTIMVATTATAIYVKRRKEKQ